MWNCIRGLIHMITRCNFSGLLHIFLGKFGSLMHINHQLYYHIQTFNSFEINSQINYSHPWEGRWFCNPFWIGLPPSHCIIISSSGLNSLKWAIVPSFSTSSMTWSSLATVSTSNEANAANGRASANSKLVMAILLSVGLSILLSPVASLFFNSSKAELSVLTLGKAVFCLLYTSDAADE